ncbi:MAG TPA: alpha/beta hydrolase [Pyrinomonadaceae bacterium]|jgi:pimeloyl-ACP methyl ester carboxylesterase
MSLTRRAFFAPLLVFAIIISSYAELALSKSHPSFQTQEAATIEGDWHGVLEASGQRVRLVLKLRKSAGGLTGTVDSPDQPDSNDLKIDTIVYKNSTLNFEMADIGGSYEGTVSGDGAEIVGRWKQGAINAPLVFRREDKSDKAAQSITRGRVKLEPCKLPKLIEDARCARYEVYEDRAAGRGRKISLNILILPATGAKPAADPVFFLAGGPGQGAVSVVNSAGDFLPEIRREREIIFIDQRGTGASNLLDCKLRDKNDMRSYFGNPYNPEAVRACRAELEKNANLTLYTTPIAMDDLDEVRDAMGYERINLYGGSYGTNAALVYLRQHGERVRSVVLKGVAPTDYKLPLYFAKGTQHALDRLMDDCAADAVCYKTFPKLKEEFVAVLSRLDKTPASFEAVNPLTGQTQQLTMSRASFADNLRVMLYVPDLTSLLPLIIHSAYENDYTPFATYAFLVVRQIDMQIARGMQLSVLCSEHIPFITDADISRETKGTYYGEAHIQDYRNACALWPSVKAPDSFREPVKSNVPVLMVSGDVDPVTPPAYGAAAARTLPNSRQIIIRNGTHLTASDCIDNLVAEFISKGTAAGLDPSCADAIKRPPFNFQYPVELKRPAGK